MSKRSELLIYAGIGLGLVLGTVVSMLCRWYPVADGPPCRLSQVLLIPSVWFGGLLILLSVLAVVFVPLALIACLFIRGIWRVRLVSWCVLFGITFGITFITRKIPWGIRRAAFARVAQRGDVIIEAIESYRTKEGRLPESLDELVPKYLNNISGTGIRAYPEFAYRIPESRNKRYKELYQKHEALYELRVYCPHPPLNFDCFFYWPSEDYPEYIYGGGTERIGKWAYVHE